MIATAQTEYILQSQRVGSRTWLDYGFIFNREDMARSRVLVEGGICDTEGNEYAFRIISEDRQTVWYSR